MTLAIAHRGDPIRHRENTLPAFRSAVGLGADMVELDVKRSLDGKAVILHDNTLHRLWNVPRSVCEMTYEDILRACEGHEVTIPLLDDVLREIDHPLMIDFTDMDAVDPLVESIRRFDAVERVLIVTGNTTALHEVRRQLPDAALGLTWNDVRLPSEVLLEELRPAYFNPNWRLLDPAFVQAVAHANGATVSPTHRPEMEWLLQRRTIHSNESGTDFLNGQQTVELFHQWGIRVSCWTVDQRADMEFLLSLGVDAITTNDISTLMEVLRDER